MSKIIKNWQVGIGLLLLLGLGFYFYLVIPGCGKGSFSSQVSISNDSPLRLGNRIAYSCQGKMKQVTGIILHYTDTKTMEEAVHLLEQRELFVPIVIDKDGQAYQLTDHLDDYASGATGGNAWGISVEIVGKREDLLKSAAVKDAQFQSVVKVVKFLVDYYHIPITDLSPDSSVTNWAGIFSHQQVDGFHPLGGRRGKVDPGEEYMNAILAELSQK